MEKFSISISAFLFLALTLTGSGQDSVSAVGSWCGSGHTIVIGENGSTSFDGNAFPSSWVSKPTHLRLSGNAKVDMIAKGPSSLTATIQGPSGSRIINFVRK